MLSKDLRQVLDIILLHSSYLGAFTPFTSMVTGYNFFQLGSKLVGPHSVQRFSPFPHPPLDMGVLAWLALHIHIDPAKGEVGGGGEGGGGVGRGKGEGKEGE